MDIDMDTGLHNSVHSLEASSTTIITNSNTRSASPNTDALIAKAQSSPPSFPNFAGGLGLRHLLDATRACIFSPYKSKPNKKVPVGADAKTIVTQRASDNTTELSGSSGENTAETRNNKTKKNKITAKESTRGVRKLRGSVQPGESRVVTRSRSSVSLNAGSSSQSSSSCRNSASPMLQFSQPSEETPLPASQPQIQRNSEDVEMNDATQSQQQPPKFRKASHRAQLDDEKDMFASLNAARNQQVVQEQGAPGMLLTHAAAAENVTARAQSTSSTDLLNNIPVAALSVQTTLFAKIVPGLLSNATTPVTPAVPELPRVEWVAPSNPLASDAQDFTAVNQDVNPGTVMTEPTMFRTLSLDDFADVALSAAGSPYMEEFNDTPMDHDIPNSGPEASDIRNIVCGSNGSGAPAAQQQVQEPRPMSLLDITSLNPEKIPAAVNPQQAPQMSNSSAMPFIQGPQSMSRFNKIITQNAVLTSSSATAPCIQESQPVSLLELNEENTQDVTQISSSSNAPLCIQESQCMELSETQPALLESENEMYEENNDQVHYSFSSATTAPDVQESRPMSLMDIDQDISVQIPTAATYFDPLLARSQKAQQSKFNKSHAEVQAESNEDPATEQNALQAECNVN
ncbi:hypothetical protein HDU81_010561, partial [Chytriomyces hyalinus]